jgi:hypothetical protein
MISKKIMVKLLHKEKINSMNVFAAILYKAAISIPAVKDHALPIDKQPANSSKSTSQL